MVRSRSPRSKRRTNLNGSSTQMFDRLSSIDFAGALAFGPILADGADASDRELQVILDRQSCVPVQIKPTLLSPTVNLYESCARDRSSR